MADRIISVINVMLFFGTKSVSKKAAHMPKKESYIICVAMVGKSHCHTLDLDRNHLINLFGLM